MENPKVLIIYTGGTIGMVNDPETGELRPFDFERLYGNVPELNQFDYDLTTCSTKQPIDSSEMNPSVWAEIAQTIFDNYVNYDGFVVLHGSDTMAYTASALSFMLQGLKKPVVLTGSQLPIGMIRTDGKENLITAVEIAGMRKEDGQPLVQEVAVYFEYRLYRGNRTSKRSTMNFEAFFSNNYPVLAEAGVDIYINEAALFRTEKNKLEIHTSLSSRVGLIKLFPGMSVQALTSVFSREHTDAVLIESFGSGNVFPSDELATLIKNYQLEGGLVMTITQCGKGSVVFGKYKASRMFSDLNVINGQDMIAESALTKLMYVLDKFSSAEERRKILETNLCGELTI